MDVLKSSLEFTGAGWTVQSFFSQRGRWWPPGPWQGSSLGEALEPGRVPSGRMVIPINRGWRYSPRSLAAGHETDFGDPDRAQVVVPHTNVALPWHSFDEKKYEFVSLYRRALKIPAEAKGRLVFVDFEGVMTASTVYINGVRLGEYRGGRTSMYRFCIMGGWGEGRA
jgi:beta-galactosidase